MTEPGPLPSQIRANTLAAGATGFTRFKLVIFLAIFSGVTVLGQVGLFADFDDTLSDLRFPASHRAASGEIVVLDIDSASLRDIGVWPWPRQVYAEALDSLATLGSAEVVFDIDFSSRSSERADQLFGEALEASGGYAMLAAFQQISGTSNRPEVNLPLERLRVHAPPVGINVITDGRGIVRSFPSTMLVQGQTIPSLAAALTGIAPQEEQVFIDFGIDPKTIDRISFREVLRREVDPARVADKQVVIGASALELRDFFTVPRHGTIPGPVLQVLAAETLKQGRGLTDWGRPSALAATGMLGLLLALCLRTQLPLARVIGASLAFCIAAECLALILQVGLGVILRTATLHAAEFSYVVAALAQEVSVRRRMHAQASRERDATRMILDRVIADNFDGVVVVDESGRILAASRLADEFFGAGSPIAGSTAFDVVPQELRHALSTALAPNSKVLERSLAELEIQLGSRELAIEYTVTPSTLGASAEYADLRSARRVACLTFHDITERRRGEQRLKYLASHDALTGALSRQRFLELVDAELLEMAAGASGITMLALDLSRFRAVNETLGHANGDMALRQVTTRLSSTAAFAVSRMGGDHFALAFSDALDELEIAILCADVLALVTEPYHLGDHRAVLGAKIGASTTILSPGTAELLLSHADMALSAAKSSSGNIHVVFTSAMDEAISEKQVMEVALRNAIAASELTVLYQPQLSLESGELIGVEALVRWSDVSLGSVSPGKFIPLAEETGLIVELGRWMLHRACRDLAPLPGRIRLAVNISPVQFQLSDVAADVAWALGGSGLEPERLDIEITEGIFISPSSPVSDALERLRTLGVGIALDDFGTGYSSLGYLGRLPIDKIKIDQSFVSKLPADEESGAIVRGLLTLAKSLGKTVVAEGIETVDQYDMLRGLGCEIGQGYYIGRPESLEALVLRIANMDRPAALAG